MRNALEQIAALVSKFPVRYPSVCFGATLSEDEFASLHAQVGAPTITSRLYVYDDEQEPHVIESFVSQVGGVEFRAQRDRAPTVAEMNEHADKARPNGRLFRCSTVSPGGA